MLSRHWSKEICSTIGSGFKGNKMDPNTTRGLVYNSGYVPGSSGFMPCCTWAQGLSSMRPAKGQGGRPLLLVSATPLWGCVMHWMTNLMCINRVSGDSIQASHEISSSKGIKQANLWVWGWLWIPWTAWFFGEHTDIWWVFFGVCMCTVKICICVYIYTHLGICYWFHKVRIAQRKF